MEEEEGHEPPILLMKVNLENLGLFISKFISYRLFDFGWISSIFKLFDGAKSICICIDFPSFYFGARWVHALEFWIQVLPIYTIFSRFFHENYILCINLQIMDPKFKRVHPTRAKIKSMNSCKNEDAICTINRDHSLNIE